MPGHIHAPQSLVEFNKANFIHNNDQFLVKAKQLAGRMTAQQDHGIFCIVVVELAAVNANQEKLSG